MKKIVLFLLFSILFVGCVPTKSLLKEQLSQQAKTTTDYKEQLSLSENRVTKLQIERDSISHFIFFWQGKFETSESERRRILEQFEQNKRKVEYYESGAIKSEETTITNKSTDTSFESYKKTIAELQSKLEQEIKFNEQLRADLTVNSQLLIDKDEKIKELTDTVIKLQSEKKGRGVFWWIGFVATILVVGFTIFWLVRFFRK